MKKFSKIYENLELTKDVLNDYLQEFRDENFHVHIHSYLINHDFFWNKNFLITLQNKEENLELIDISKFFSMLDELTNRISEHGYMWKVADLTWASNTKPGVDIRKYLHVGGKDQMNIVKIHYTIEFFKKIVRK